MGAADDGAGSETGVSAVLVSYHTGSVLFEAIDALRSQPLLRELIVVENGNPEADHARLRALQEAGAITLLTGHGNIGFAAGCNLGARRARGEWLLLLNPDCLMPENGLARLVEEANRVPVPDFSVLSGCLLNPDGTEQRGSRRQLLTPRLAVIEGLQLWRIAPRHPYFRSLYLHRDELPAQTSPVPVVSGAVMLMKRRAFSAIGGMDEGYFLHVEDIDFCLRFRRAGGTVYFVPHVKIRHHKSSSAASPVSVEWHKAKGFRRYFRKHFRKEYPGAFLLAVEVLIFVRFGLVVLRSMTRRLGHGIGGHARPREPAQIGKAHARGNTADG